MASIAGKRAMCASLVAAALMGWSARPRGIERKPLPDFLVTALDGTQTPSATLMQSGHWLLVSVRPGCSPCDHLMQVLDPAADAAVFPRLVIVIGGVDAGAAAKLAAGFKDLHGVSWYADPTDGMKRVLPLAGAPVVFGMRASMLEWSLAGVVPDSASMRSALISWATR